MKYEFKKLLSIINSYPFLIFLVATYALFYGFDFMTLTAIVFFCFRHLDQKIDKILNFEGTWNANNFCEDMNSATQLLNQFAEIENVAIQKDEGKWDISADCWQVSHEELPMAICLGFIKWKERGTKKHENKP